MAKTNGTSALKEGEKFTLEQWRSWPEGERWELIDGTAYDMSPSPRIPHQRIARILMNKVSAYLEGKHCEPFIAPTDVYLSENAEEGDTVVQPDVLVVCDPKKIREDGIHGAPDFVAEILSVSTASKDITEKKDLYEKTGVREYWVLNPRSGSVFQYVLKEGKYGPMREILNGEFVESFALPGFSWKATPA
jgi:Uma2 family endonuclease